MAQFYSLAGRIGEELQRLKGIEVVQADQQRQNFSYRLTVPNGCEHILSTIKVGPLTNDPVVYPPTSVVGQETQQRCWEDKRVRGA